jgi:hypothetical protein
VVPVYIELKLHKASELSGLLDRALAGAGLPASVIAALKSQDPLHPLVRLVVLADGFDELQGDLTCVADFVGTICGGAPWPAPLLKVIVTSRENRLGDRGSESTAFGGPGAYKRLLMLPFSRARVRGIFLFSCRKVLVCNAGFPAVLLASCQIEDYIGHVLSMSGSDDKRACSSEEYAAVLQQRRSVLELVRNPFVLRLFVDALPSIAPGDRRQLTRYTIYRTFVHKWFDKEVSKMHSDVQAKLGLADGTMTRPSLLDRFELLSALLAGEMLRRVCWTLASMVLAACGTECRK